MLKGAPVGVLLSVMALGGLLASSAGAANWHTNGPKAFSATGAGATRVVLHPASGSPVTIACSTFNISGTLNGPTSPALPWVSAATVTPTFGNCTINAVPGYTTVCSSAELRANSYVGGDTLATAGGGVTTGAITGVDCVMSFMGVQCSTITGSVPAHYVNPSPIATGSGRLTLTNAGQALTASKINPGCAAIPHGSITLGSPVGTGVGDTTFTLHGPNASYIYRGT